MLEIAKNTAPNGHITEEYTVYRTPDGDIIIDCRRRGASEGDTFHVPAQLCPWLAKVIGGMEMGPPDIMALPVRATIIPIRPGAPDPFMTVGR